MMVVIVCFENPVLRTGSQKETLALPCFLCLTAFGRKTKPPVKRLCRNSKRALLKPVFGGVLPLNLKNNSLQRNLRGHDFADNNYDTASKHGVFKASNKFLIYILFTNSSSVSKGKTLLLKINLSRFLMKNYFASNLTNSQKT